MKRRHPLSRRGTAGLVVLLLTTGCTTHLTPLEIGADHPARADAAATPFTPPPDLFADPPAPETMPAEVPAAATPHGPHGHHEHEHEPPPESEAQP